MKDKLELMQKIYDISKIEPDMWAYNDQYNLLLASKKTQFLGQCTIDIDIGKPYYPLEQVLRELKTKEYKKKRKKWDDAIVEDDYLLVMEDLTLGFARWDYEYWVFDIEEDIDDDYHQPALRLWLRVLEKEKRGKQSEGTY